MSDLSNSPQTICCIGEVLWDALPEGLFLGGAPLNVCYHLTVLGEQALMVSRVGNDRLGREALRNLKNRGVPAGYLQTDEEIETGFVKVNLSQKEGPDYEIIEPAAWDFISFTDSVAKLAKAADIIVFGTLGQRSEVSRKTIQQLIKGDALGVYDVNLRPPFDDPSIVRYSLREADIVKMNEDELMILAGWFSWSGQRDEAVEQLAGTFGCQQVCITCGKEGSILFNQGTWTRQEAIPVKVRDTVGSGDAFLAGFIFGMTHFKTDREGLQFASLLGAFVATKQGANPPYSLNDIINLARAKDVQLNFTKIQGDETAE